MTAGATTMDGMTAPPADTGRAARRGWYTLAVILVVALFAYVDRQVLILAGAPMAASLGLSDGELGLIQGMSFAVFTVLAVYPIAWLADRMDRRTVLCGCIIVWAAGTAACGLAGSFEAMFIAAVAIAAGEAGLGPIALSAIPDLFSGRQREIANMLFVMFSTLGGSIALVLGGFAMTGLAAAHDQLPLVVQQWEPWRIAFFVVALPAPLLLPLVAFARLGRARPPVAADPGRSARFLPFLRQHGWPLTLIYSAVGFYGLAVGGYAAWYPVAATRLFGASPADNGLGMGIALGIGSLAGMAIATFLVRRLLVRVGPSAPMRMAWVIPLLGAPLLLSFPFLGAAWHGYVLVGLLSLGAGAGTALLPLILQDMAPARLRARTMAIYTMVYFLVGGNAPTVVGLLSGGLGGEPQQILVALTLIALPSWLIASLLFWLAVRPFTALVIAVQDENRRDTAEAG